jgi:hypothetical protein
MAKHQSNRYLPGRRPTAWKRALGIGLIVAVVVCYAGPWIAALSAASAASLRPWRFRQGFGCVRFCRSTPTKQSEHRCRSLATYTFSMALAGPSWLPEFSLRAKSQPELPP